MVIRQAGEPDRTGIEAMHAACSLASRIGRWHAPLRRVPPRYLTDAVSGRPGHACAVACDGPVVLGFASAVRGFGEAWDLGVLVRDDRQRRGIGRQLLDSVVTAAFDRGAGFVTADLRPDRRFLLAVLGCYGPVTVRRDGDGLHARVELSALARLQSGAHVAAGGSERGAGAPRVGIAG
jgi:GNAT superfamily N-acetyltransferase